MRKRSLNDRPNRGQARRARAPGGAVGRGRTRARPACHAGRFVMACFDGLRPGSRTHQQRAVPIR